MAKPKSPKVGKVRSQNKKNSEKPVNGASESIPVESAPVTHAEQIAAEIKSQRPTEIPAPKKLDVEPLPSAAGDLEAAIRQRAYEIFLERRGAPGNPMDDWARAEREVLEAFHHQKSA